MNGGTENPINGTSKGNPLVKDIFCSRSRNLLGKKIVICITGSVAAYKAIDLTRLLIRHGAEVFPVMSKSASSGQLLASDMMKWASGNNVVTKLTANLEHILLADYNMSDLILVYPCTANTIGKTANGIDDTPVTSLLSVALGSNIPIIIAPAMHKSMYFNAFITANIQNLIKYGVRFIGPFISENKAKLADPEEVLHVILDIFNKPVGSSAPFLHHHRNIRGAYQEREEKEVDTDKITGESFLGRNILVTAGSTVEFIDPIRMISNLSSGRMGNAIAQEAHKGGANVTLVYGHGSCEPQDGERMNIVRVSTSDEMYDVVMSELGKKPYDAAFMSAAIADFKPSVKLSKKMETRKKGQIILRLSPTKKIVNEIKNYSKNSRIFLVAFKADYNKSNKEMVSYALKKMNECSCDLVVANDVGRNGSEAGSETSEVIILNRKKQVFYLPLQKKELVARKLLEFMVAGLES